MKSKNKTKMQKKETARERVDDDSDKIERKKNNILTV